MRVTQSTSETFITDNLSPLAMSHSHEKSFGSQSLELSLAPRRTKNRSCECCAKRKVKCNKEQPCSNCIKYNELCCYVERKTPLKRRRENRPNDGIVERLRNVESILAKVQETQSCTHVPSNATVCVSSAAGYIPTDDCDGIETSQKGLRTEAGKSPYNNTRFWSNLTDQVSVWYGIFMAQIIGVVLVLDIC